MENNVGNTDQIIRFLIALVLMILSVSRVITGFWGTVTSWGLSAVLVLTALDETRPLYSLLGISTCSRKKTAH